MPEIGLGIRCERGNDSGVTWEWLYWYDELGNRYLIPKERVKLEVQRAEEVTQRAQQLARKLPDLGIDPETRSLGMERNTEVRYRETVGFQFSGSRFFRSDARVSIARS